MLQDSLKKCSEINIEAQIKEYISKLNLKVHFTNSLKSYFTLSIVAEAVN